MDHISKWLRKLLETEDFKDARLNPDGGPGEFYEPYPWEEDPLHQYFHEKDRQYVPPYAKRCRR